MPQLITIQSITITETFTSIRSIVTTGKRDKMFKLKNKLVFCEAMDKDEAMDEEINLYEVGEPDYETTKKSRFKKEGNFSKVPMINTEKVTLSQTEVIERKRTLYSRDSYNLGSTKNTLSTSAKGYNKSASDVELDIEMSIIHSSFQEPEKKQSKFPLKKAVAANKPESKVVMRSYQKTNELDQQSDYSEEESEAEVIVTNKKTLENEEILLKPYANKKRKNNRKQRELYAIRKKINYCKDSESDSPQEQELVTNFVKEKNSNQEKARQAEVNRHKKSTHNDHSLNKSDSSQEPESIVEAARKKTTKKKKTRTAEVFLHKKLKHTKPTSDESDESDSSQEPEPVVEPTEKKVSKQKKTREAEVHRYKKSKHRDPTLNESDSSQEQEPIVYSLNTKTKKGPLNKKSIIIKNNVTAGSDSVNEDLVGQNKHQSKVLKPNLRNKELEGLKIRYDRELMSEFDEGINLNDSNDHSIDLGIYPNVHRVANCERKLRIRRSYSRSFEMHSDQFDTLDSSIDPTEELQTKKRKKRIKSKIPKNMSKNCSAHKFELSSVQQMPIHDYSHTITEEALSYANLITRFQDYGQNSTLNTSEASTSTRVHSNNLDMAQMEDLNFVECDDGVLFGKYVDSAVCGVIQFLEGKYKDFTKSKRSNIKLFLISGELEVTVAAEIHILKPMGFMVIHYGTEYRMHNSYKGVSMVLFTKDGNTLVSKTKVD